MQYKNARCRISRDDNIIHRESLINLSALHTTREADVSFRENL